MALALLLLLTLASVHPPICPFTCLSRPPDIHLSYFLPPQQAPGYSQDAETPMLAYFNLKTLCMHACGVVCLWGWNPGFADARQVLCHRATPSSQPGHFHSHQQLWSVHSWGIKKSAWPFPHGVTGRVFKALDSNAQDLKTESWICSEVCKHAFLSYSTKLYNFKIVQNVCGLVSKGWNLDLHRVVSLWLHIFIFSQVVCRGYNIKTLKCSQKFHKLGRYLTWPTFPPLLNTCCTKTTTH